MQPGARPGSPLPVQDPGTPMRIDGLGDRKALSRETGALISYLRVPRYTLGDLGPVTASPWTLFAPLLREITILLSPSLSP